MTSAELRALVAAMTERPWSTENPARDIDGWSTGAIVCATAPRQAVYSPARRGTAPEADRKAIAALANHADALVELVAACEQDLDILPVRVLAALARVHLTAAGAPR
jgi:hypothetical protein